MALLLSRRGISVVSVIKSRCLLRMSSFCSRALDILDSDEGLNRKVMAENKQMGNDKFYSGMNLSPLLSTGRPRLDVREIQVVDEGSWEVSSGLAQAWREMDGGFKGGSIKESAGEGVEDRLLGAEGDSDFDEIDNMRIRGDLFYQIERSSKEFEEYSFDFHRRKSSQKEKSTKEKDNQKESKKKQIPNSSASKVEKIIKVENEKPSVSLLDIRHGIGTENKKVRTPTFNQLTGPYHEPFCLDIYISKASVRACIIHRVTSKVVAVAHSISKDMKFDLASTRNAAACSAVGQILAQRALADDIHDIIYTPRKGEKIEGKLQIVLQSIMDNGINVKVKLKQRKPKKDGHLSRASQLTI